MNHFAIHQKLITPGLSCARVLSPWGFPGKNSRVSCHFFSPGDLPNPGIKPTSPTLAGGFFTTSHQGRLLQLQMIKRKRKKKLHSICKVILEIIDIFIFSLPIHEYGLSLLFKHCQYVSIKFYNFLKNLNI